MTLGIILIGLVETNVNGHIMEAKEPNRRGKIGLPRIGLIYVMPLKTLQYLPSRFCKRCNLLYLDVVVCRHKNKICHTKL